MSRKHRTGRKPARLEREIARLQTQVMQQRDTIRKLRWQLDAAREHGEWLSVCGRYGE